MSTEASRADSLHCPTCGAQQLPALQCRRCKCDLSLLVAVRNHARQLHQQCLLDLSRQKYGQALGNARRLLELSPDQTARRLLAIVYLCLGQYQEALGLGEPGSAEPVSKP